MNITQRLAVCSWSMQPASVQELIDRLKENGILRTQLSLDPFHNAPDAWTDTKSRLEQAGITIVSGMFGFAGEDYSTLETIRNTGGVVPDATWEKNWEHVQFAAAQAVRLGMKLVSFHAGFLPHNASNPRFHLIQRRILQIADHFATQGIQLGFETGQETAESLASFLLQLGRPNVGVNFDPANMILYDKGSPIEAVRVLGPWIRSIHVKDARRTKVPGTWGEEVPVGTGDVDWLAFFQALKRAGFKGDLCIEREAGNQRMKDIQAARDHVTKISSLVY